MIASKAEPKQSLNLSGGHISANVNGPIKSPSKSSSSDTNNSAHQLTSNNSISSNETVIAPPGQQQQRHEHEPEQQQPEKTQPTLANGAASGQPEVGEELPGSRPRGRTLKSFFYQFAGQHLNLFHHHSQNNNNNNLDSNWTPTKQRAQAAKRASDQLVGGDELHEQVADSKQASYQNGNFLVSFAQKCFHLNFSSSGQPVVPASANTIGRNCHSCPVTPVKQQHQLDQSAANEDGGRQMVRSNGCPGGGGTFERTRGRGSLAANKLEPNQSSGLTGGSKRPQVRFVVESSEAKRGECDEQHHSGAGSGSGAARGQASSSYPSNKTSETTQTSSGKPRGGYFMINKRIRPKQARVKLNDCGVQTSRTRSLLEDQSEFIEDDEERARLVELLFKLPEGGQASGSGDGGGGSLDATTTGELAAASHNQQPMDSSQFREHGYRLIDYICNYLDTIRQRRVTPINIEPGYLKTLIKPAAPERGEPFSQIMHDFENHIMCGITHWQHPHFHAYFPAGNAYPSILADMLSDALGCMGFSWAASPAITELEIIMLDWMGKMIGLPDEFLCLASSSGSSETPAGANVTTTNGISATAGQSASSSSSSSSKGGGVIQGSASECVLVNMLAARHWAMDKLRKKYPNTQDGILLTKLISYCSKEAHSCVEKAAMIACIRMRALETDEKHSLRGETLRKAIELDMAQGLEPFIVCATLGTTSCVSFDNLRELGEVCRDHDNLWLHVDAAYAGSALICDEFKYLIDGIELATSFNMNPNKWMLINFDCSLMWVKDRFKLTRAFVVDPLYLQHSFSDQAIDYRHWGIPLSRRFRALKLWFVIRNYGVDGLRQYIRNHVRLAKLFESLIREDKRFIITNEVTLGLVCFRLLGSNALNQRLLSMLNASGKLHMVPASLNGRYIIRFCVCDQNAKAEDIRYAYECISQMATELFELIKAGKERIRAISQQNTIDVSNISLHTQQSASADRLSGGGAGQEGIQTGSVNNQHVATAGSATRPSGLLRRSSTRQRNERDQANAKTTTASSQDIDDGEPVGGRPMARSPLGARSPRLTKQASIRVGAGENGRPVSGLSQAGPNEPGRADLDEDLEQEVPIDSLATIDGCDYDLEDDDQLDEDFLEELQEDHELLMGGEPVADQLLSQQQQSSLDEQQLRSIINDSISPIQRGRLSRASGSVRSSSTRGAPTSGPGAGEEADEAADELVKLADKRNRMSLRYKREFFVRVVSDPRVYRASISGDINAHTSSTSSLASQPASLVGTQRQQSTTGEAVSRAPPQRQQQESTAVDEAPAGQAAAAAATQAEVPRDQMAPKTDGA